MRRLGVIASDTLRLRETTPDDLEFVLAAESDDDTRPFILLWSRRQHLDALTDPDVGHLVCETEADRRPVGFVMLAGLTNPHGSIEFRRIVITEKGKGHGREAVELVKQFVFERTGAHRLWLDVKVGNDRAKKLYEGAGFVVEGTLRECLKAEKGYESLTVMGMLRGEWETG